eukprot:TRINITY_DN11178_c2_g1_i3.p2 TRINITY_DN11178_c2_g1~~TRINITY_DN11178_c2_g1_i3.p2  ORF type:complete len:168 (-),score=28.44 TRINITY_DN11178_c2_g1_i3:55-558(-)
MEDRRGSAMESNLQTKGDNAYYYAHSRHFEVPEDAKVISGPGLITGGAPVLLEVGSGIAEAAVEERTVWLKDYSWSDSTDKVKVYVPLSEGVLPSEGATDLVESVFGQNKVDLVVKTTPRYKLTIERLHAELNTDSCSCRVEAHKSRIVLQLAKKRSTTWYNLTKSK